MTAAEGAAVARLRRRYHEAADTVFMDGSTPWEVDEAMEDFGFALGPYAARDLAGLDTETPPRDPARRAIPLLGRMLELGKLGRKTGAGWYRYPGGGGRVEDPIVADLALEESHFEGRTRTDYDADAIRERLLLALAAEAVAILETGALTAARIDALAVANLGFPDDEGGPLTWADRIGAAGVLRRLDALSAEDPVAWQVPALLRRRAAKGARLTGK